MRRRSAAWMASAMIVVLERNLAGLLAWTAPSRRAHLGSGARRGRRQQLLTTGSTSCRPTTTIRPPSTARPFSSRRCRVDETPLSSRKNVSPSPRRFTSLRLRAAASSSNDASSAGTSTTFSSSSSSSLAMDVADAKRKAQEAMDLYHRNVASTEPLVNVQRQVSDLEMEQSQAGFWDEGNSGRAAAVNNLLRTKGRLLSRLQRWRGWEGDVVAALDMLSADNLSSSSLTTDDATMLLEELRHATQLLMQESLQYELELLLSGPYDASPARLVLTCGAGGTESNDWVSDLYRMYRRHCEKMGFRLTIEDEQPGDVTGYKSVELLVEGDNAYGWLQGEKGAHRLVRLSPYNANNKRQTTFAGVDVAPLLLDETVLDIEVLESDLEMTAMRAGGKGGQNVNKVNSAVRIKHVPTGLQVKCAQERSQVQNKQIALQRLKSQLLAIAREQRVQQIAEIRGDHVEASWGAQIRNYVLHPYRLVKDQRTGWETSHVQGFLDGDLDECIGAYLRHKARQEAEASSSSSAATDETAGS